MAASPTIEQKCPACGAPLRFDPQESKLVCDYCGTVVEITKEEEAPAENSGAKDGETTLGGFDFDEILRNASVANPEELPIYNCQSCGAEIIADPETVSLTCPYCGNNIVLTEKVSGSLRPDGVLPFKLTPKELPNALQKFYSDKKLLPRDFFSAHKMGEINGVYVPFWIFSGKVSGKLDYIGERIVEHTQGNYRVVDTHHYRLSRAVSMSFKRLPVDASGKMEDALMDSIEPFDFNELKPFDMRYLAGYTADRFDDAPDGLSQRATDRMINSARSIANASASAGYTDVHPYGGALNTDLSEVKYVLLPVYHFKLKYGGTDYQFAVNGQTGKIIGTLPVGKKEKQRYFWTRFGIGAAIALAVQLIAYFI